MIVSIGDYRSAAKRLQRAQKAVALTGAGISVDSGIPDFRSTGGLWTQFPPEEYATLDAFLSKPDKAWKLYRALGQIVRSKKPNPAHTALARLESQEMLSGVITQNIDGLHGLAGSQNVVEIHGNHRHLHCIKCGHEELARPHHFQSSPVPFCPQCKLALKPRVVLFGELIREMDETEALLESCDLLLVIGTSAEVYPAAAIPARVARTGGNLLEFNVDQTHLSSFCTHVFTGPASETVPLLEKETMKLRESR